MSGERIHEFTIFNWNPAVLKHHFCLVRILEFAGKHHGHTAGRLAVDIAADQIDVAVMFPGENSHQFGVSACRSLGAFFLAGDDIVKPQQFPVELEIGFQFPIVFGQP